MNADRPYFDRYPALIDFIICSWDQTAIHPTLPAAAEFWITYARANGGMVRLLDREVRRALTDGEFLADLGDLKQARRLADKWSFRVVTVEDLQALAAYTAQVVEARSADPRWWHESKKEMDKYLDFLISHT